MSLVDEWTCVEHWWKDTDKRNLSSGRRTSQSATLYFTNPTRTDLRSKPGLRSDRPATNRLSHGTASTSKWNNCIRHESNGICLSVCLAQKRHDWRPSRSRQVRVPATSYRANCLLSRTDNWCNVWPKAERKTVQMRRWFVCWQNSNWRFEVSEAARIDLRTFGLWHRVVW
jgi:hypothetical protein